MSSALDAWLYGTHVATFSPAAGRTSPGVQMTWTPEAAKRWGDGSVVLSNLLPTGTDPHPAAARAWLEGLMPEGTARTHQAVEVGVDPDDTLAFLSHYGRDTAGALVLVPAGEEAADRVGHVEVVDDERIAAMLLRAAERAGGVSGRRDSLTSLAGMEPKIALALDAQGRWNRCVEGAPSTHILKLSREAGSATADTIDTEAAALDLARRIGLTTVEAHVATFDDVRAIVVTRYDRITRPTGPTGRLHQEDTAQAIGLNTREPEAKFQHGRKLPSLARIAALLREGASEPDELLRLTTFNLAIGNTDAHAKNISLLHPDDGTVSLAPAYDVAMHLHADTPGDSAMDIAGQRKMREITGPDLVQEATSWGMPARRATRVVAATLDELRAALEEIDRDRHPGVVDLAWRTVENRTQQLAGQVGPVQRATRPQGLAHAVQPRRPKGSPRGGQFGTVQRSEPDLEL